MSCFKSITLLAAMFAASSAFADPVGTISYSDTVTPNIIYGTAGGQNGGFTVSRDESNGLELGLRARVRFANDFMDQGNGTYGNFATSSGPNAVWNFDFSVNSNYNGSGQNLDTGYSYILGIDFDPAVGNVITSTFNLSTTCVDNQFGTNTTATNAGVAANCAAPGNFDALRASNNVMQNSENLGFLAGFFGQSFDPSAPGEYSFFLRAVNSDNTVIGETDITVNVANPNATVPEPATLALMSAALVGLGVASRRRKTRG